MLKTQTHFIPFSPAPCEAVTYEGGRNQGPERVGDLWNVTQNNLSSGRDRCYA